MNQQLSVEENIRQGMAAIRGVIRNHVDNYQAMHRPDVGNIAFYWGRVGDATRRFLGGYGLSKIVAEKGDDIISDIIKTVARGRITRRYGAGLAPRLSIEYMKQTAILARIAQGKDGLPDTWLLAEWIDQNESEYQPTPGELPFADVVPGKITEPVFPGNEPPDVTGIRGPEPILEAALTGDWQSLRGIFEKPKPEYVPGMFLESVGYDNNSPDAHLKLILDDFRTYAAPYLMEKYRWTQQDIEGYINNPENTLKVFDNMTREAKKYWEDQGVDPGKIILDSDEDLKKAADEFYLLSGTKKTREEFDKQIEYRTVADLQRSIAAIKARQVKAASYREPLQAAKSFDDIFAVFKQAFKHIDDKKFSEFEASTERVKTAIALLRSGETDPEARYFAFKQMDIFAQDEALAASGLDRKAILAEFGEENQKKVDRLFVGYSAKGYAVIESLNIPGALVEQAQLALKISETEDAREQIHKQEEAPFLELEQEAMDKYVTPEADAYAVISTEISKYQTDRLAIKPYPGESTWMLTDSEAQERREWQDETDKGLAEIRVRLDYQAERVRTARAEYWEPINKKKWEALDAAMNPLTDQITEMRAKQKQIAEELHAKLTNQLLEQSPVTAEQAAAWIKENALMDKKAITKARKAGYAPEEVQSDLATFYRMTGGRLSRLEYTTIRQSRSAAAHWSGQLYVGSSFGKRTFFHELAHLLEEDPKIVEVARNFLEKRRESATVYSLSSLTGNTRYKSNEGAYKDAWHDPYVGKVYSNATEVISMGMQMLASPDVLLALHSKDPGHLALILGLCASKPYVDSVQVQAKQGDIQQKKATAQKTDDVFRDLDKKIAKAGDFWTGNINSIDAYTKYGGKKPSQWTVYVPTEEGSTYNYSYRFKSEKNMKRALYLWITNGKPKEGMFSMDQLKYALQYGNMTVGEQGLKRLIDTLSGAPASGLP